MKYFDRKNNRLIFEGTKPTSEFWDNFWIANEKEFEKIIREKRKSSFVSKITKKYIRPNKNRKIFEGGCGIGAHVSCLDNAGYDAYGIDFANKTIEKINQIFPSLKISHGNVEKTEFPDNFFDAYWSLGVIEHFYGGYDETLGEMTRLIKRGGYLFLIFPSLSLMRKLKIKLGLYPIFDEKKFNKENFYQFAFDPDRVRIDLEKRNFKLIEKQPFDGLKGLKDEMSFLRPVLQKIYDGKSVPAKALRLILSKMFSPVSNHSVILIFKKHD